MRPVTIESYQPEQQMKYQVIDRKTGAVVGEYTSKQRARNRRDTLDLQYGAVRYFVKLAA